MCEYLRIFLFTHSLFDFFNSVQKSHNKFRNYVQAEITAWTDSQLNQLNVTNTNTNNKKQSPALALVLAGPQCEHSQDQVW